MKINYADSNLNREKCIMGNVENVEDLLSKINEIKSKKDRKHYVIQLTSEEYSLTDTLDLTGIVSPITFVGMNPNGVNINSLGNVTSGSLSTVKIGVGDEAEISNSHNFTVYHNNKDTKLKIRESSFFTEQVTLDINEDAGTITNGSIAGMVEKNSYIYFYTKWVARRMRVTEKSGSVISFENYGAGEAIRGGEGFIRIVNGKNGTGNYTITPDDEYDFGNLTGTFRTGKLSTLVKISHSANITFENIEFSDNGVDDNRLTRTSISQAEINPSALTAAIEIVNSTNIKISKCTFRDLYGYCVGIDDNSSRVQITGNTINGTYGGGIQILNNCCYNCIENNTIGNFGEYQPGSVGIIVTKSHHNRITNNHIYNGDYTGISLGWTWGYGESNCFANYVARNHIHHCMRMKLNDGGGIYTLGKSPGTVIENNVIHDIVSWVKYDSTGIYFDEGSSDIVARSNVIYGCHVGVHQHYGYNNELDNNLFAHLDYAVFRISMSETHLSLYAHNNIILLDEGILVSKKYTPRYELANNLIQDKRQYKVKDENENEHILEIQEGWMDFITDDIYTHAYHLTEVNGFTCNACGVWTLSPTADGASFKITNKGNGARSFLIPQAMDSKFTSFENDEIADFKNQKEKAKDRFWYASYFNDEDNSLITQE